MLRRKKFTFAVSSPDEFLVCGDNLRIVAYNMIAQLLESTQTLQNSAHVVFPVLNHNVEISLVTRHSTRRS